MKRCIACDEEIQPNAKICRFCKVSQTDVRFVSGDDEQNAIPGVSIPPSRRSLKFVVGFAILSFIGVSAVVFFNREIYLAVSGLVATPTSNPTLTASPSPVDEAKTLRELLAATQEKILSEGVVETWLLSGDDNPIVTVFDSTPVDEKIRIAQWNGSSSIVVDDGSAPLRTTVSSQFAVFLGEDEQNSLDAKYSTVSKLDAQTFTAVLGSDANRMKWVFHLSGGFISAISKTSMDGSETDQITYEFGETQIGQKILKNAVMEVGDF